MKKEYDAPKAEKLEFDYKETVVASTGTGCVKTNDLGQGNGCNKPGHAHYNDSI